MCRWPGHYIQPIASETCLLVSTQVQKHAQVSTDNIPHLMYTCLVQHPQRPIWRLKHSALLVLSTHAYNQYSRMRNPKNTTGTHHTRHGHDSHRHQSRGGPIDVAAATHHRLPERQIHGGSDERSRTRCGRRLGGCGGRPGGAGRPAVRVAGTGSRIPGMVRPAVRWRLYADRFCVWD